MARPKAALVVTPEQRQTLDSMAHRARTAPLLARRARIVLACATGLDNTIVAKKLRMSQPTVGRWRQRFIDKGVDGLLDEPRPGTPRKIGDTQVETIVTRTLESTPPGATHWSTRTLAKATGVSPMSVHRMAGVRVAAASHGDVHTLARSAVDRQGPRHRRVVSQPTPARGGLLCR